MNTRILGAGNLDMAGRVTDLRLALAGLGNLRADNLQSTSAMIGVSGAGGASVNVRDSLDVKISGAGAVRYRGSPKLTEKISGVGVLSKH